MKDQESREQRRSRQDREFEASQRGLRESIARTRKLLDQSDQMIQRHRKECDEAGD